jgi:hypothetical protein
LITQKRGRSLYQAAYYRAVFAAFARYVEDGHPVSLHTATLDGSTEVTLRFDSTALAGYMEQLPTAH